MSILFNGVRLLPEYGFGDEEVFAAVDGARYSYIGRERPAGSFAREINAKGKLLVPGFYNAHCHSAMTLFRGYGEDLPLSRWLEERIFPAEDKLTEKSVYYGSMLAIAEMLRNGIVSFSDMYMFCGATACAVLESGIKANISRSIVSFDPELKKEDDLRFIESKALYDEFNGAGEGRVKIDMALHAEYTNKINTCRYLAEYAKEKECIVQIHLSETEREHLECIERNGMTPTEFFLAAGVLDCPVCAAHCVYVSESDMDIMKEKGVSAVHNPTSNLKLGSGVMPLRAMLDRGINVALGTDGAASNNTLDLLGELRLASILHKGVTRKADITSAREMSRLISQGGARAQRRDDCGKTEVGQRADGVLIDMDAPNNIPCYDTYASLCYSVNSSNVVMTMVDGRILFENGEYTSIDKEKLIFEAKDVIKHYFD